MRLLLLGGGTKVPEKLGYPSTWFCFLCASTSSSSASIIRTSSCSASLRERPASLAWASAWASDVAIAASLREDWGEEMAA